MYIKIVNLVYPEILKNGPFVSKKIHAAISGITFFLTYIPENLPDWTEVVKKKIVLDSCL